MEIRRADLPCAPTHRRDRRQRSIGEKIAPSGRQQHEDGNGQHIRTTNHLQHLSQPMALLHGRDGVRGTGEPVTIGKENVEDDRVVLVERGLQQGRIAIAHSIDSVRRLTQTTRERVAELRVILDYQDAHGQHG